MPPDQAPRPKPAERGEDRVIARSRVRRWVRAGRIAVWITLAVPVVWLTVTRWNGVPADPSGALGTGSPPPLPIDPRLDRTEVLTKALESLPADPALTLPPPPLGYRWKPAPYAATTIDPSDALNGDWTPQTRPNLQATIEFLETPPVQSAMARIASIEPGGWRPTEPVWASFTKGRQATKLFVARARYHHGGRDDIDAALADLQAAYRLAGLNYNSGTNIGRLVAMACEGMADTELQYVAREHALSRAQAAAIISSIERTIPDLSDLWQNVIACEHYDLTQMLDWSYTEDGHGDGWLVLNRLNGLIVPDWAKQPRSGAWNALSPLFNSRRTVAGKIDRIRATCTAVANLPFDQAVSTLRAAQSRAAFNLLDGPFGTAAMRPDLVLAYSVESRISAYRRLTIVTVALSAYRHDHGEYPTSLAELEGAYLGTVPLDPFVDRPLRYGQEAADFKLYSVGPDQRDNEGKPPTVDAQRGQMGTDGDIAVAASRGRPYRERTLEEIRP